jgi:hypothetical protein
MLTDKQGEISLSTHVREVAVLSYTFLKAIHSTFTWNVKYRPLETAEVIVSIEVDISYATDTKPAESHFPKESVQVSKEE